MVDDHFRHENMAKRSRNMLAMAGNHLRTQNIQEISPKNQARAWVLVAVAQVKPKDGSWNMTLLPFSSRLWTFMFNLKEGQWLPKKQIDSTRVEAGRVRLTLFHFLREDSFGLSLMLTRNGDMIN